MISTPTDCTSDYYSGSDLDYDEDDVVKAAPQHHSSTKEINVILQTLLQHHHKLVVDIFDTNIHQQSITLFKLSKTYGLSDEVFIRAHSILRKFLLSTCTNEMNDSILVACLSLATKLTEHSNHFSMTLFNSHALILNENMICNAVDWDIDMISPLNYVEAMLVHVNDCVAKDHIRKLSYELIVLCLNDMDCMNLSVASIGMGCLLLACELFNCCEIVPKEVLENEQTRDTLFQISLITIREFLMRVLKHPKTNQ